MVIFNTRLPGTPEAVWASSSRLRKLPALELGDVDRTLVLSAHPDDETLGAGGLISRLAALGVSVDFLIASNGEASHPNSPTHSAIEIRARRREELSAAAAVLAPRASVEFLGLPDGRLSEYGDELGDAVRARTHGEQKTLVLAPWAGDGHPDHEAIAMAARGAAGTDAFTLREYPVWLWHWSAPDDVTVPWPLFRRCDLDPTERRLKNEAIQQHRSQIAPLSSQPGDEAVVDSHALPYFQRDFEVFLQIGGHHE